MTSLCRWACQALIGAPGWGPTGSSVRQAFGGPASLPLSCGCWHVKREAVVTASPPSVAQPCFPGCRDFLHRHFPRPPRSHSLDASLRSQQQPSPWDFSTMPRLQLPAAAPSRGPVSCPEYVWLQQGLLILIPFGRPQVSCFTFSLQCFSSD